LAQLIWETVWLANIPALETLKPLRPPQVLKISCAGRVIYKYPLKFWERRRETTGVHNRHSSISITVDIYGHWIPGEGKMDLTKTLRGLKAKPERPYHWLCWDRNELGRICTNGTS
jgi:hypothetical protein